MNAITGKLFVCPAGHQLYLPYRSATTALCDLCRGMVLCSPVPPTPDQIARENRDAALAIQEKFERYAETYDRARQGMETLLTPDPANEREAVTVKALQSMGYPDRHIAGIKGMDAGGMKDARAIMDVLARDGPSIAVIWGDYGRGKTQLAAAVAMLRFGRKERTRYITGKQLTRAIKDNFGTKVPEAVLLRKYHECAGLVIDDIHQALDESPDDVAWARTQFQEIVDVRYSTGKPLKTILICNADDEGALTRRLGAHIISRVQECGRIFRANRKNYRSQAPENRQPYADA